LRHQAAPGEIIATSTPHWAYLITGRKAVQPPRVPDPASAEHLLESVPVTYLVIDHLIAYEAAAVYRRYTLPVLQAFPSHWQLIYTGSDSGSNIYQRMNDSAALSRMPAGVRAQGAVAAGAGNLRR